MHHLFYCPFNSALGSLFEDITHEYNCILFRMLFSQVAVSHCSTSNVNSPNWGGEIEFNKSPFGGLHKSKKEHSAFKQTVFLKREEKVPALSRYK